MLTVAYILMAIGAIFSLVGGLIVVIAAFRVSVVWGLVVLFLSWLVVPLVIFLVKHWPEARTGFLIGLGGWVVTGLGWFFLAGSLATTAMAELESFETSEDSSRPTFEMVEPVIDEPEIAEPSPTPEPTPEPTPPPESELGDEASPLARDAEVERVDLDDIDQYIGRVLDIRIRDGKLTRVVLDEVTADALQVTQRMGGGSVSYSIPRDTIEEIHAP